MKISLTVLGEIKVDYYVDGLDVNSSSEEIYKQWGRGGN
jgi:hypothetical protein